MNDSGFEMLDLRRLSHYLMQHSNPLAWVYTGELIPGHSNTKIASKELPMLGTLHIRSSGMYELRRSYEKTSDPTLNSTKIGAIYFEEGFISERESPHRLTYERADLKLSHKLPLVDDNGRPIHLPSSLISVRVVKGTIMGLPIMTRVDKTMGWVRSKRTDLSEMLPSSAFLDKSLVYQ